MTPHAKVELTDAEPNGDTPIWVRILYRYGIPGGIALFLVWFVTSGLTAKLEKNQETLETHVKEQGALMKEQGYLLQQICVNTATSDSQRALCFQLRGTER